MTKELFVSSTPHETKVALVEDEQVAELYFERENEYTLAGSIYKGRVTRVLPGMQSAFVDIGLERDAFLYVSDFLELQDEEGEIQEITVARPSEVTATEPHAEAGPPIAALPEPPARAADESAEQESPRNDSESGNRGWKSRRRRRGRRGRGLPESKFVGREEGRESHEQQAAPPPPEPEYQPMILPGESISKYQRMARPAASVPPTENLENTLSAGFGSEFQEPEEKSGSHKTSEISNHEGSTSETEDASPEQPQVGVVGSRFDVLDWKVAAAFSGDHDHTPEASGESMSAGTAFAPAQSSESQPSELPTGPADSRWESERVARPYSAAHSGTLEEEEIEDEESGSPEFAEELEDENLEEMEEETRSASGTSTKESLEHNHISNGVELTEAYKEAATEREAFQEEFVEEENGSEEEGPSIEERNEADLVADAAHEEALSVLESGGEDVEARAEVRAPAATAGLQQRSTKPWERRRGGRRFPARFRRRDNTQRSQPAIADLLKEGQEILVQIAKEPINKKGARITSHIALPGRFLVYMPTVNHTGVSRKIASEEERFRLKRIVLSERENGHGGFIVRTAAEGANEEELRADIRFLKHLWAEIKQRAENSKSPALIYHDLNLVERILRDQVTQDFSQI
jgi:Ribonuclease G/E